VSDRITRGHNAIFGRVARMPDNTPAHQAMLRQVELSVGRPPDPSWKRPPGRPRTKWTDQLRRDNNSVPIATLWSPSQHHINDDDDGNRFEDTDNFCYLGSIMLNTGRSKKDIQVRIGKVSAVFGKLENIWKNE